MTDSKIIFRLFLFFILVLGMISGPVASAARCPSIDIMKSAIKKTFRRNLNVQSIEPSGIPGLCQVNIKIRGQNRIIYTDTTGGYLLTGQIFRVSDGINITREALAKLNRLSPEDMKRVNQLTAFSVGSGKKTVYLVTDPQCPFCKKAENILSSMVKSNEITLKVLLFPLRFHKGSKEECISIICDDRGFEGLKNRYRSENQCAAGIRKVENTISFLQQKGITATPTYIFPDGTYHSGVLMENVIRYKLGLTAPDSAKGGK